MTDRPGTDVDRTADRVAAEQQQLQVLRILGLDPRKPESHALLMVADRYDLDPLLHEVELIASRGALRPYVTRAGMLRIAHRSGQLDGIVTDELRRNSTGDGWTAYVSVWRKDAAHPFRMGAQCKDTERQAHEGYGPEQALARAMRRALVVAFAISTPDVDSAEDVRYVHATVVDDDGRLSDVPAAQLHAQPEDVTGPDDDVPAASGPARPYTDAERAPFDEEGDHGGD